MARGRITPATSNGPIPRPAFVTYDKRLLAAATNAGLPTASPGH